jgi:hypothetical protein
MVGESIENGERTVRLEITGLMKIQSYCKLGSFCCEISHLKCGRNICGLKVDSILRRITNDPRNCLESVRQLSIHFHHLINKDGFWQFVTACKICHRRKFIWVLMAVKVSHVFQDAVHIRCKVPSVQPAQCRAGRF